MTKKKSKLGPCVGKKPKHCSCRDCIYKDTGNKGDILDTMRAWVEGRPKKDIKRMIDEGKCCKLCKEALQTILNERQTDQAQLEAVMATLSMFPNPDK